MFNYKGKFQAGIFLDFSACFQWEPEGVKK